MIICFNFTESQRPLYSNHGFHLQFYQMITKHLILAVLLCSATLCQMNSCPGYNTGDRLQSGKNAIMRGAIGGNPEYTYQAPINFAIPSSGLQIAVTTGTIGDYNPLPNYGYNYYIEANRKPNSNSIIYKLIMNNDQSWTSIQLSYLACGRDDMTIGNFQSPIDQWTTSGSNVYTISKSIDKVLPKASYKVAAFISGFSTTDSQFTLTITKKSYQTESKKLTVLFYSSANPAVLTVTISYIIYPEVHTVLDLSYDLTPRGDAGSYQISGPVNFQPNKRIQYNEWRVENRNLPCTGNECSNTCVLRQECARLNGNIYEGRCIYCPPGIIFQFGLCTRKCGLNQIFVNRVCVCARGFTRKGKDCVAQKSCGTNQVWDDATKSCICAKNSFSSNSECRLCPDGSVPTADGRSCFCNSPNQIYDVNANICKNRCSENQVWLNNKCACIPQHSWWNQNCRRCPDNCFSTPDQSTCACKSPNAYFNPETYSCVECTNGLVLNKAKSDCVCSDGSAPKNGVCVLPCKSNQVFNPNTRSCQCLSGLIRGNDGLCRPACGNGEVWVNNGCACAPGFARVGGVCKACPSGSVVNDQKTGCVCSKSTQIFALDKFVCIQCIANSSPNADRNLCVCNNGYVNNGGSCVRNCIDPQIFNVQTGSCDCKSGFVRDASGQCRSRCSAGEAWDGFNCVCPAGYAKYGSCKLCPANTLPNSARTSCICTDSNQIFIPNTFSCLTCPVNSKPNADLTLCVCNSGYTLSGNSCILNCGLNQEPNYDAGRCDCVFGFHRPDSTKCVPRCSNVNQEWNGNSCICKPGCGLFSQVCTACPKDANANADRTSCLCIAPNFIFNPITFKCEECPDNSRNNNDDTRCVCNPGFISNGNICSPTCDVNEALNVKTNQCECKYGFLRLGPSCVERCGLNQQWDGNKCLCKANHVTGSGVCRPCPDGTVTNVQRTTCICKNKRQIFSPSSFSCIDLPSNCDLNDDYTDFNCYPGYKRSGNNCINTCPNGAFPDNTGKCICGNGYYLDGNTCKPPATCPPRSTWNSARLACVCDNSDQNIINGQCQTCGENSIFLSSTKQCVCNTGFFLIGGQCTICDARTKYNGTDCVCNLGTFGNRDKCETCHASCSRCSGPEANQCQSCSDVSLVLQKGFCSKNSPCDPGFYLSDASCTKCGDNCIICNDIFECQQCAIGYQIQKVDVGGQVVQACTEICGDGIRYEDQCDDGNTASGDGCSNTCTVEAGWTCSGGSSAQKSVCRKFIPDQTIITSKGVVNLGDRVTQSIRASFLPTCLTANECSKCFKILQVNVVNANVPILVKVSFVPFSQYQFIVEYNFQGLVVTSKFKTVIKLNPDFKGCLADDDFNQQIQLDIDPAFLALVDQSDTLSFDSVNGNANSLPAAAKSILGVRN